MANVSHELRTPLSAIHGYAETLLDGALDDAPTAQEFTQTIFRHSTRLSQLVADLLDLSKLESPDFVLELEPLALADFARGVVSIHMRRRGYFYYAGVATASAWRSLPRCTKSHRAWKACT